MTVNVNYPIAGDADRAAAKSGALLGPLSILARQKKTWTPLLLAGVLWRAVTNIGRHHRILRLLKLPAYAELAQTDPRFAFKYLTHDYLARGLTVAERAACFAHHYERLHDKLPSSLLRQIFRRDVTLTEIREGDHRFGITMGLSKPHDKEGEFSLNLLVDGEIVFVLSFTIVPGRVVQSAASDVLFITRLQGVKGHYGRIALATKSLHDVAPGALLVSVLQGIGQALGIGELASIQGADQTSYCADYDHSFRTAYDEFFAELGVEKNAANYFVTPIPMQEKPLVQVKQGHKLRTREKREFKRQIADEVCWILHESCRGTNRLFPSSAPVPESGRLLKGLYAD